MPDESPDELAELIRASEEQRVRIERLSRKIEDWKAAVRSKQDTASESKRRLLLPRKAGPSILAN